MRTTSIALGLAAALVLVAGAPRMGAAFDGFDVSRVAGSGIARYPDPVLGKLVLGVAHRGGARTQINDVNFADPNAVNSVDLRLTLVSLRPPGPGAGETLAGIVGFFYWDGSGTGGATDQTGHAFVELALVADGANPQPRARYRVQRCTDAACSAATTLATEILSAVPLPVARTYRLRLAYDAATGAFSFQLDDQPPRLFVTPDAVRQAPSRALKALRARIATEAAPTAEGRVLVWIDDVFVNGQLHDDFDARPGPLAQILPPTGVFLASQVVEVAVTAETRGDPVVGGRLLLNDADVTAAAGGASIQLLPQGGVVVRFGRFPMGSLVPPGTAARVQVELRTQSGDVARAFAVWEVVQ
jgi:hypothetical protein